MRVNKLSDYDGKGEKYEIRLLNSRCGTVWCGFAHEAYKKGKKCLVIDKREHLAGNIYTEKIDDIDVHKYGAHIFILLTEDMAVCKSICRV